MGDYYAAGRGQERTDMAAMKTEGEEAPDFRGQSSEGEAFVLSEWTAKGPVVLYFYLKNFTPG